MDSNKHTNIQAWKVLENKDLRQLIVGTQEGITYKKWTNGDTAAYYGHLSLIKLNALRKNTLKFSNKAIDNAARNNHLKVVQWLSSNRKDGCTTDAIDWATENGHLEMVQWLVTNGYTHWCVCNAIDTADCEGHVAIAAWLRANRTAGCISYAMKNAYANGTSEQWVRRNIPSLFIDDNT